MCRPAPWVTVQADDFSLRYQMVAAIEHHGSSSNHGHYVAFLLEDSRWFLCDDDIVADTGKPPEDTPKYPSMMLYRRHTDGPPPTPTQVLGEHPNIPVILLYCLLLVALCTVLGLGMYILTTPIVYPISFIWSSLPETKGVVE